MIYTHKHKNETWVDIHQGTADEIKKVMDDYNIHPFTARELSTRTPKPSIYSCHAVIF